MATVDEMNKNLEEILKVLQTQAKASGTAGPKAGGSTAPKTLKQHFMEAFEGSAKKGLGVQDMVGQKLGQFGAAAGQGFGSFGAIGAVVGLQGALVMELAKAPGIVRDFVNGLHSANREFAKVSPAMAGVMAMSDLRDTFREMRIGNARADSAKQLADARGDMEDQGAKFKERHQRGMNRLGAAAANVLAPVLEGANMLLGDAPNPKKDEKPDLGPMEKELQKLVKDHQAMIAARAAPVHQPGGNAGAGDAGDLRDFLLNQMRGGDF